MEINGYRVLETKKEMTLKSLEVLVLKRNRVLGSGKPGQKRSSEQKSRP
jgi:hypothetical protein